MVSNNVLKDIQRLISITNTGLAFSKDPFDQERYQDIRAILQDLVREATDLNRTIGFVSPDRPLRHSLD